MDLPSPVRPTDEPLEYSREMPPPRPYTAALAGLTLMMTGLAAVMFFRGLATWLEATSVVLGAVCVWLTVRESIWNFPLGLINVATFCVLFFRAKLYADAGLQVAFFVLTAVGWYLWLFGGERRTALKITRAPRWEAMVVFAGVMLAWGVMWYILHHHTDGAAPIVDALTTALSLAAQWMLSRKHIENWIYWIIADVIYVPLYCWKGLYLTGALYLVFLCMATMGLVHWRRLMKAQRVKP